MPGTEKRNLKTDGALLFRKKKKKKSNFSYQFIPVSSLPPIILTMNQ